MDSEIILPILSRWAHVLCAVTMVGGVLFLRFILMPSASEALSEEQHLSLKGAVLKRWKKVVMLCILLLLLSGVYNLMARLKGDADLPSLYHALFGIKFLLALAVFFIASCLVGRAAAFEGMRKNMKKWLLINVVLALCIVLISGVLKNLG